MMQMDKKIYCHRCGTKLVEKVPDGEDRERMFCGSCNAPVYENPVPATAVVVANEKNEILLVQRGVEPAKEQWCLPGGFLEVDETAEEGSLRELKEETGLEGDVDGLISNEISHSPFYRSVLVLGYRIKNLRGQLKAGDDCIDAHFFDSRKLPPVAFRSHRAILSKALNIPGSPFSVSEVVKAGRLKNFGNFGAYVITSRDHLKIAEHACKGGARIIQYRDKKASRKTLLENARAIREITRKTGTLFIVNDYVDIAILCDADGVHLGQDDISIADARELTPPGFVIGRSTHSLEQAIEAEKQGADYIGSGPVFATPTKETYVPIGIDTVREVVKTVDIPVIAIGGLNLGNYLEIKAVGAKNFAMVRAFQENTKEVVEQING